MVDINVLLLDFATHMTTTASIDRGRLRLERSRKRVRVYLGGEVVADTRHPRLVWEVPYYPGLLLPG